MKKRIIALLMVLVLCALPLCGCGAEANYFTELKDTLEKMGNISETTIKLNGPAGMADWSDSDGTKIELKVTQKVTDNGDSVCDIDLKLNDKEYNKLTTLVKKGNYLYFTTDKILSFMDDMKIDENGEMANQFKQMGIEKAAKINIKQACKIMDIDYNEDTMDLNKYRTDCGEYIDDITELLEKYFGNLAGKSGSDYTLTVDKKNVSTAIDDFTKISSEDIKETYDSTYDLVEKIGGEKTAKDMPKYKDVEKSIKDYQTELKESKKDIIKEFDEDFSMKSIANSKEGKISLDINNFDMDEMKTDISIVSKNKNGEVDVDASVPKDAVDITALLNQMTQAASSMDDMDNMDNMDSMYGIEY